MAPDTDVVRRYCDAWMAGDLDHIISAYHDDIVLHWPGRHRLAGDHVGLDAALAALGAAQQRAERQLIEVHDILEGEHGVAVIVTERWTLRDPGESPVDLKRVLEYRVADGKLRECWIYESDQAAIDHLIGTTTQM